MASKPTKNLADFKSLFDRDVVMPEKIKAALAALAKEGPEAWEPEGDFIRRAQLSQTDMAKYREQFEGHFVEVKIIGRSTSGASRRVWFGSAATAAKARGM